MAVVVLVVVVVVVVVMPGELAKDDGRNSSGHTAAVAAYCPCPSCRSGFESSYRTSTFVTVV